LAQPIIIREKAATEHSATNLNRLIQATPLKGVSKGAGEQGRNISRDMRIKYFILGKIATKEPRSGTEFLIAVDCFPVCGYTLMNGPFHTQKAADFRRRACEQIFAFC
jgi:hypothetical protein